MFVAILSVLLSAFLAFYTWLRLRKYWRKGPPLPPGPRPHFLLGNLRDVPRGGYEWLALENLSKTYGSDIIHFQVLGRHIVSINSFKAANDLLDKKSGIYSDRPRLARVKQLLGWRWILVTMSYHEGFAAHRRLVQQSFQPNIVTSMHRPVMRREVHKLLGNLLTTPDDFRVHLKSMAGAIIMMVTYGYQVAPKDDPYVKLAEDANRSVESTTPGAHFVDFFPILQHLPALLFEFKRRALVTRKLAHELRNAPFQMVKERMAAGTALPSMVTSLLENEAASEATDAEELIKNCAAAAYSAGADTTAVTLTNFFLAMITHPQVQERARLELDEVVGRDRLPSFDDRPRLPYISCIVKELLRWKAVSPLGIPHCTTTDDIYQGMFIPKGTSVLANISAMLHDESMYADPDDFNPDRFVSGADGSEGAQDPSRIAFGFGRRICPGRFFADDTLWLAVANILHVFKIEKKKGPDGSVLEPSVTWASGAVSIPSPFACEIAPRLAEADNLIPSSE
ncbi:cytochrome P450 [Artomyces pyxidatus]|uniref:Cytochrome P450 n=1 Tax=Artomyces pyxidatus TaxID=48021 RepID=A0ACB8SQH5_9AGAM|nr:cytochrome P450 [Artomyces pyxidatus]